YTKWFDYDIIKDTVEVRTRRPGDYLVIDTAGNRQKLKTFFINEKIPHQKRDQIWLIAKESQILWVIGYRMGHTARITEQTRSILEISIYGGEEHGRDN
ncbi:MAG TPA: tRNA(Ile)-lysidine synthetase, partial [Lachnospiraceae bacterium]|nr:tRNA(Ile)-lysidine synthetase [Lachnospiraceae bacterium]